MQYARKSLGAVLISTLSLFTSVDQAQAQQRSIINQSFEQFTGTVTGGVIADSEVVGWHSTGGGPPGSTGGFIEVWVSGALGVTSADGVRHVELNPFTPVRLSQDVCLINGETLAWSYSHRARADSGSPLSQRVQFSAQNAAGTLIQSFDVSTLPRPASNAAGTWVQRSGTSMFIGATGLYNVGFEALNAGGSGNLLDNINIVPTALVEFANASSQGVESVTGNLPEILVSGVISEATVITLSFAGSTATPGSDFTIDSTTITIPTGTYDGSSAASRFTIPVTIINDDLSEPDESISVAIASVTSAATGAVSTTLQVGDIQCAAAAQSSSTYTIATGEPEIDVQTAANVSIADGGTDAQGTQVAGVAQTITYTIINNGTDTLTLGTPTLTDGANTTGTPTVGAPGSASLAPGATTTITVGYTPENAGAFDFDIVIPNNDADENPYNIEVTGTATGLPEIDITSSVNGAIADGGTDAQGTQVAGVAQTITYTIINNGTDTLTLGTPTLTDGANTTGTPTVGAPGSASLAPGATTTITVGYTPENAGAFDFDIVIPNNDADENPYNIEVNGSNTGSPEIDVQTAANVSIADGGTDAQGSQVAGTAQTITYTIINNGTDTLTLGTPTLTDGANTTGTPTVGAPGSASLAPGATTTITVGYTPENAGAFDFDIVIPNNDADENPYNIEVNGATTGSPEIGVTSSVNGAIADGGADAQGTQIVGAAQTITYTITNSGTDTLTLTGTPTVSGPTNITGAVGVTYPGTLSLAPGATTTFAVTYTPAGVGPFSFDIDMLSNDADEGTYDIAVSGVADGEAEIDITSSVNGAIADNGVDAQGTQPQGTAQTITYSITNSGTDTLTLTGTPTVSGPTNITGAVGVTDPGTLSLAPGATTTFAVTYTPAGVGPFSFDIDVLSNDADEGTYDIAVSGIGESPVNIEAVQEILSDNLLQTTTMLSQNASGITRRAAGRLGKTNAQTCREDDQLTGNLDSNANSDGAGLNGNFSSSGYNCADGTYTETWGELSFTFDDDSGTLGMATFGMSREAQANGKLRGRFVEGYLSKNNVDTADVTGSITGVGVHAGLYGAHGTDNGLILSYYGSAAIGQHSFDLIAGSAVDGNYTYAGAFAGVAVGGKTELGTMSIKPRVGIDLAYAAVIGSEVSVPDTKLQIDPARVARGFIEFELAQETNDGRINFTPRLFCEARKEANACGFGAAFEYMTTQDAKGTQWSIGIDYETIDDRQSASLDIAHSREILNGLAVSKSSFGATGAGSLQAAQTVEFAW